jgi:hypothetical protein
MASTGENRKDMLATAHEYPRSQVATAIPVRFAMVNKSQV